MSMNTVEKFLNIPIDYYIQINMEAFKDVVDAGKNIQQMEIQEKGAMFNKIYYGLVSPAEKQRVQSILRTQLELNKKAN